MVSFLVCCFFSYAILSTPTASLSVPTCFIPPICFLAWDWEGGALGMPAYIGIPLYVGLRTQRLELFGGYRSSHRHTNWNNISQP